MTMHRIEKDTDTSHGDSPPALLRRRVDSGGGSREGIHRDGSERSPGMDSHSELCPSG